MTASCTFRKRTYSTNIFEDVLIYKCSILKAEKTVNGIFPSKMHRYCTDKNKSGFTISNSNHKSLNEYSFSKYPRI